MLAERQYTDAEAETMVGVSHRVLQLMQTAGMISADKIPRPGGSYIRSWRKSELAVAAIIHAHHECAGMSYVDSCARLLGVRDEIVNAYSATLDWVLTDDGSVVRIAFIRAPDAFTLSGALFIRMIRLADVFYRLEYRLDEHRSA
jgi:hypothetical protein